MERKSKELDEATEVVLAKAAEVEAEIESAKHKRYKLNKTNKFLQEYSSALDQAIEVVLVKIA